VFDPRPAFADAIQDGLSSGAVGDVGGSQVDHQQPAIGIDRDMTFAANNLLARVVFP
jgi:hypothetical protein